ncbi:MAG TPA: hypothetical protein PKE27_00075 [Povalibacter sp.]|uniref:hypothetical protein n=1 Tax=Povalibacter sp. TaxID=1962978 RepID=UPI002B7DA610|nr:hypothetical protein [Povalibacter sp.]HMN42942.1 hypothetical protein [Povalibacter sp.]
MSDADLAREAALRISGAQEVALALGELAQLARELPSPRAQKLSRAFILLAECQAALMGGDSLPDDPQCAEDRQVSPTEVNVERFLHFWRLLQDAEAGERAKIVCSRTGWSQSKYYRIRTDAIERGLI